MPPTDICHHCRYSIPHDASTCPGCGRRHGRRAPRARLRRHPRSLQRDARWARRLFMVTGWLGLSLGLVALARGAAGFDRVAVELVDDATLRLDHLGRLIALSALFSLSAAALTTVAWVRQTASEARALHFPGSGVNPWSLPGWLIPGKAARDAKVEVDHLWRENSPLVGALRPHGSSRQIVSTVVFRWWSLWLWVPAAVALAELVAHADAGALLERRGLVAVAAGSLLVSTARAYYDVLGIITVAHAHQRDHLAYRRAQFAAEAPSPTSTPHDDDDDADADADASLMR